MKFTFAGFLSVAGLAWASAAAEPMQKWARAFPLDAPSVPAPLRAEALGRPWTLAEQGPLADPRLFAQEGATVYWLGSTQGVARLDTRARHPWDRWQYFAGHRWLPDDEVRNIFVEPGARGRRVWVRTRTGAALLEWRPMTLEEKAAYFDARIEARHVRHGLVADCGLAQRGDLSAPVPQDNDNDGLWTAMYLAAESYRYAVTKSPEARARAQRAARALMRLEEITGRPGFPARSFVSAQEPRPHGGEWHATPDGAWLWKGDTSSDELVGHYYGYALYFDLVASPEEKQQIARVVGRITDHLIEHGYDLIDLDGQPTRWGQWSERYFATEEGRYEAPLRSLELLAFLQTAHHLTGDAKYLEAYRDRLQRGYGEHMRHYRRWEGGGEINFSDDELAYLSYDPLLRYERDAKLRAVYLDGLRHVWSQIRADANPLWGYISVASGAEGISRAVRDASRRTLERIPMNLIDWRVTNSRRADVTWIPAGDRFERRQIREVLAPDELPAQKWNSNPHVPDGGGNGHSEDDGAFFLLPYWMGRYHGWVK